MPRRSPFTAQVRTQTPRPPQHAVCRIAAGAASAASTPVAPAGSIDAPGQQALAPRPPPARILPRDYGLPPEPDTYPACLGGGLSTLRGVSNRQALIHLRSAAASGNSCYSLPQHASAGAAQRRSAAHLPAPLSGVCYLLVRPTHPAGGGRPGGVSNSQVQFSRVNVQSLRASGGERHPLFQRHAAVRPAPCSIAI